MDTTVFLLGITTATIFGVTVHAWHLGNERRDVALLGAVGGAVSALSPPLSSEDL